MNGKEEPRTPESGAVTAMRHKKYLTVTLVNGACSKTDNNAKKNTDRA